MGLVFNPFTGNFDFTGSGGGGGTINGTIANTQIAFGTALDTIGGSANLVWDGTKLVTLTARFTSLTSNGFLKTTSGDGTLAVDTNSYLTGLTVGSTTIASGSPSSVFYNNGGVLGEYTNTGTAGNNVLSIAPTLTGPVTINSAVGSSGLTISGATQTTSQPALNITQTWNAVGTTFTGFKHTITDTASATESLIFQYLVGASNRLALRKNGTLRLISVGTASNAFTDSDKCLEFGNEGDSGYSALVAGQYGVLYHVAATPTTAGAGIRSGVFIANGEGSSGAVSGANAGVARLGASQDGQGLALYSTGFVRWNSSTTDAYNNGDLFLYRDAANVLAQRNSTNAQKARWYSTYTNSSNGAWAEVDTTTASTLIFGSNGNGTGASTMSKLQFNVLATNKLDYAVTTASTWTFADSVALADAKNLSVGTTTGTKIGTATTQKLSFWNATPIVQPTTAVAAATFVANTSLIANDTATFDGYTIGQVVKALRNFGVLA